MTINDTVSLALRNLRQAKLRTALTTLGVSIGIASLAGMVSLGVGLQDQLTGQFLQSGVFDAITVAFASSRRTNVGRPCKVSRTNRAPPGKIVVERVAPAPSNSRCVSLVRP